MVAFMLMTQAAAIFAAGTDDGDGSKHEPVASSAPGSALMAASLVDALKRKQQTPLPDDSKDNWPTDDFGRPLRSCDVPWDFVPQKE